MAATSGGGATAPLLRAVILTRLGVCRIRWGLLLGLFSLPLSCFSFDRISHKAGGS